jgi:hypothetical protein
MSRILKHCYRRHIPHDSTMQNKLILMLHCTVLSVECDNFSNCLLLSAVSGHRDQ